MLQTTTAGTTDVVEIIPGELYGLGGLVELDGRISWAPSDAGYQPVNSYLLLSTDPPTLVDTGLAVHRTTVIDQLRRLLPDDCRLNVFLTRSENDCVGNVGAVMAAFDLERLANLYTGGGYNPFDGFDDATVKADSRRTRPPLTRLQADNAAKQLDQLAIIAPPFRTLSTYWAYHPETKTLFTSDLFGHTSMQNPNDPRMIEADTVDDSTIESVKAHLLAKFFWLDGAHTDTISAGFAAIFEQFDIEIIAPTHGRIFKGKEVVQRHYDLLQEVIKQLGSKHEKEVTA